MDIVTIKVSHRSTPPGACVEFIGKDGQTIEVELRGDEFVDMADDEIIRRAKTMMGDVSPIAEA